MIRLPAVARVMTVVLDGCQSQCWQEGSWEAWAVLLDVLDDVDRAGIDCAVQVRLPDGTVAFTLDPREGW